MLHEKKYNLKQNKKQAGYDLLFFVCFWYKFIMPFSGMKPLVKHLKLIVLP